MQQWWKETVQNDSNNLKTSYKRGWLVMEAMHSTDLFFFRRNNPSPVPVIEPTSKADDDSAVSSSLESGDKHAEEDSLLRVEANEDRTRGIINVSICSIWVEGIGAAIIIITTLSIVSSNV